MAKFRDFDLERIEKNEEFWLDQCGIKINRDNIIVMGAGNTEFGRGILVPNELLAVSHNRPHGFLKSGMEKSFPVSIRGDLDKLITRNVRWPIWNSYLVYFRDRQEADVENDGLSADDLEKKEILGINCVERMIYEWQY
ncbi:MAG TPA: hypothetical protein VMD74_04580, partial [Candidatus Methylomirabilis sp.]|nr:hypothetical protein [Candidatus Methylomirabilis sp.]